MKIVPPQDSDSENVKHLKLFMLACFARRNLDPTFERQMLGWLNGITEDEFMSRNNISRPIVQ
jgi:hypothetical protein